MKYWRNRLGVKLAAMVMLILIPLLLASFLWLEYRAESIGKSEQETRAVQVAESLVATLSSIMLSGNADIAHFWLERVSSVPGVEAAKIFRTDGAEAFYDQTTLKQVNDYIGEQKFVRDPSGQPHTVPDELQEHFKKASQGDAGFVQSKDSKHLNYMSPIRADGSCMGCHGYDNNPIRGVLMLDLSTDSFQAATSETKRDMLYVLFLIVILLALFIWLVIRKQVLEPLNTITKVASNIRQGDLSSSIKLDREDELGLVASTFDQLVLDLKQNIAHEADQRQRQEDITNAVIALGQEAASASLLKQIGETCMSITGAPYAMISYIENGKKQFIAHGLSTESEAAISHPPQGKGLLGLLWKEGETVRTEHIAAHPKSVAFPDGHPPMDAFLGTPMRFEDKLMGSIYLAKDPGGKPFTADDEKSLVLLATACAVALSNTQNYEIVEQANEDLESRVLDRTHELDQANKVLRTHEIELELINDELLSANKAKDQFLANTSHELRTPLNAIIGFSELLSDTRAGTLTAKQERYVGHVHNSGKRLLNIINDLLDISKIEAGMMEINETVFNPDELGQQLLAELKPLATSKNISLNLIKSIDPKLNIRSDRDKLHQVLVNLVGNAIKFSPEGEEIEVGLTLLQPDQQSPESTLSCCIKDNGIGIPIEDQEKIFLPFIQSEGGLDRAHGGTGLGLSLAKRMVELLGGSIQLTSEVNKGSTFQVNLSVLTIENQLSGEGNIENDDSAAQSQPAPVEEVIPDQGPQPVIMIVDENISRANVAECMFANEGYQVIHTELENVESMASRTNPFLIILGIPDDSDETYDRLLKLKGSGITNRTPTILMAGDEESPRFSAGGTIGQIEKGIARNDLLEMVSHYGMNVPLLPPAPTVLVVDDDASVREYLKETLAPEGYHILLASNGAEGVRLAIEREPDLIILDLMMPGTTGFEVVDKLRQHPTACDIPVVIFTAKDLSREEALLLGQDVERILIKGVSKRTDVLNQIHKLELLYPVQAKLIDVKLGCFNLRYMQRRLSHEVARHVRYAHNFSLISWQMDDFDRYCNNHGQRWGTAALKVTVGTAQSIIRKGDVLARLDNNSFILLLPGITKEGTAHVAEKIRLRISHQRLPLPGKESAKMTASIGVVTSSEQLPDADLLLATLQHRVSIAAEEGGNRAVMED